MKLGFLRLHLKALAPPSISFETMLGAMQEVYTAARIKIRLIGTEQLDLPDLADLEIGDCESGYTPEQAELYAHRGNALAGDVVAFVCRTLIPPFDGCATHPPGQPSVVLRQDADRWALAHEIGHLLGLTHVYDDDRLMTGNGTLNIINQPPDLTQDEIDTMRRSPFVTIPTGRVGEVRALLENHQVFDQKLATLPPGGRRALAELAATDESAIACKAVHLASLLPNAAGAAIVEKALSHRVRAVRITAAASIHNLPSKRATTVARIARIHEDDAVRRAVGKKRLSRVRRTRARDPGGKRRKAKPRSEPLRQAAPHPPRRSSRLCSQSGKPGMTTRSSVILDGVEPLARLP